MLGASLAAWGQGAGTVLIEPPTPLLAQHTGGLVLGANASGTAAAMGGFDGATCGPVASGGSGDNCAAVLKEDGLRRYASGTYTRAAGAPLQVFALEFGDATGALSAYTFYRSLEKQARVTAGDLKSGRASETTTDAEGSLAWAGTAVLRVVGRPTTGEQAALTGMLPKVGGRRGLAPLLPTYLPVKGIEPGTERYALGPAGYKAMGGSLPADLLAWDKSAEVMTANYAERGRGGSGAVTLMLYPTPQIAGDRGRALEQYVNKAGLAQFGTLKMRRVGPMLGMTTGAFTAEQAMAYMTGLHLNQDLSFDKPMPQEFHAEMRKTATLLQAIAAFCGLGLVAAIVLGFFFGGARAGIRMLQGKSAASDPEFLTINLRSDKKGLFAPKESPGDGRAV